MLHVLICSEKIKFYWKLCFKGAKELSSSTKFLLKLCFKAQKSSPKNLVLVVTLQTFFQRPKKRSLKTLTLTDFKERFLGL
jgi:hypothetical protein